MTDDAIIEQFTAGQYIFTIAQQCSGSAMPAASMVQHVQDVIRRRLTAYGKQVQALPEGRRERQVRQEMLSIKWR